MCKCVICGKEWDAFDWKTGTEVVEPGKPITSMCGIYVCNECKPIVYEFRARIEENHRQLTHILAEWYKIKKY